MNDSLPSETSDHHHQGLVAMSCKTNRFGSFPDLCPVHRLCSHSTDVWRVFNDARPFHDSRLTLQSMAHCLPPIPSNAQLSQTSLCAILASKVTIPLPLFRWFLKLSSRPLVEAQWKSPGGMRRHDGRRSSKSRKPRVSSKERYSNSYYFLPVKNRRVQWYPIPNYLPTTRHIRWYSIEMYEWEHWLGRSRHTNLSTHLLLICLCRYTFVSTSGSFSSTESEKSESVGFNPIALVS